MPKTLRGYILAIIILLIIGYALFVGRNYLRGLSLTINEPRDNASLHDPYLLVSGDAARVRHLLVNGAPVSPEKDGSWSYALLLPSGYSIINVEATDRFGRSKLMKRAVYYNPNKATGTKATTTTIH